jgi:A/G-specific adenine glycosylase
MDFAEFQKLVRRRGQELYRDMPWRRDTRPYYILVSELMLQQTQVARVIPKFEAFTMQFPDIRTLAAAPLADVLRLWSGLGYNRRAKYLHEAARRLMTEYTGDMPADYEQLKKLPGIGPGTAGALMAYAFNQPVVFIETNVRTVYFHYFFEPDKKVSDRELVPLIEATIDTNHPREFYWALMDYGTWLKQNVQKNTGQSVHYKKQSKFKGSIREVRGHIVRLLGEGDMTLECLQEKVLPDERFMPALEGLIRDELVTRSGDVFHLAR